MCRCVVVCVSVYVGGCMLVYAHLCMLCVCNVGDKVYGRLYACLSIICLFEFCIR